MSPEPRTIPGAHLAFVERIDRTQCQVGSAHNGVCPWGSDWDVGEAGNHPVGATWGCSAWKKEELLEGGRDCHVEEKWC